ncbi:lactonase, 7-bladed beta-propeller [Rhizoctonia solani]|uniref:Lactonase, 7-bladed beta-propeller n=1 Tax=Rhizoctonia solani TaxID=456999 RepID=A0A8H8T1J9_9AGAM|nr:lactonase, 7-bladed beta-propeller [Rhizoctonia solani]QRW25434.1 lactonase, 7-bladed beta-propeller [Rhizoctonia solani]
MVASTAFTLLVGAYSSVITGIRFDPASTNLSVLGTSPSGNNPSWIATHPLNNSIIVATNEGNPVGGLSTFLVTDRSKGAVVRSSQATTGADPAYIVALTKPRQVVVMDYSGGSGAFIPLREDLLTLDESKAQRIKFNATPGVPNWTVQGFVEQVQGSGPRHIAVSGDILYTLNELKSTLVSQTLPPLGSYQKPKTISSLSIVPQGANSSTFGAAELILDEKRGLLYASNRNLAQVPDPRGDTIAIFSFDKSGNLKLVKQVFTGLNQIRAMSQGGEDTQYIAAGGKEGGGLVVYEKINNGQDLKERARLPAGVVAQPASFAWL